MSNQYDQKYLQSYLLSFSDQMVQKLKMNQRICLDAYQQGLKGSTLSLIPCDPK